MTNVNMMLGLHAETHIHAGAGSALGVIDLPIQREAPTGYPVIFASSVKGALRAKFAGALDEKDVSVLFGAKDGGGDAAYAGALLIGDARLLALPVRSLSSHFFWVTCPYLLNRLRRDAARMNVQLSGEWNIPVVTKGQVLLAAPPANAKVFLEEYCFEAKAEEQVKLIARTITQLICNGATADDTATALEQRIAVVSDDDFSHLMRSATPVAAHVAINSENKTVMKGALWYEETLPAETLLYVPIVAGKGRCSGHALNAKECADKVSGLFEQMPYLQIGGNETLGMGWCHVALTLSKTAEAA